LFGRFYPRNQPPSGAHLPLLTFTAKMSVRYIIHPVVLTSSRRLHHPHINMPGRTRPIDKLATAVGKCSTEVRSCYCTWVRDADVMQSAVYGKCIFADYNNVHKDMCANEFMKLKECYLVGLRVHDSKVVLICCRKRTKHGDVANQRLCDWEVICKTKTMYHQEAQTQLK
jgi:hypothetical protein